MGAEKLFLKNRPLAPLNRFLKGLVFLPIAIVRLYQWTIRPLIGPRCRFLPHCSDYAIESFERHGLFCGAWLTAKRLGRCHPWCEGGLDPVPAASVFRSKLLSQQTMID